jgi:hypothetical protein
MTYNRMEAKPMAGEHCRFVAMTGPRWSKRRVVISGYVAIRPLCRFAGAGDVKWSMNALACAMPTIRISMAGRGKVVRNAVISGRPDMTNSMRRTPSTGPGIERGETLS